MRSRIFQGLASRNPVSPVESRSGTALRVEALEGRALMSYLIVPRGSKFVPVHVADARSHEPLFSNGLAAKKAAHFYPLYTGPQRPELNGIQASGYVKGKNLVLTGTVAGPIVTRPKTADLGAIYSFAIDRGGAGKIGPFPGRPEIRFDAIVTVTITNQSTTATVAATTSLTNQPGVKPKKLSASAVTIKGATVTVTVPISTTDTTTTPSTTTLILPSNGHPDDQWNVNFFARSPTGRPDFHSVASFTPEHTMFQIFVKRPSTS